MLSQKNKQNSNSSTQNFKRTQQSNNNPRSSKASSKKIPISSPSPLEADEHEQQKLMNVLRKYISSQELKEHEASKQHLLTEPLSYGGGYAGYPLQYAYENRNKNIHTHATIRQPYFFHPPFPTFPRQTLQNNFIPQQYERVSLQRVDIDVQARAQCNFLQHEIRKINDQISKIQNAANKTQTNMVFVNCVNNLVSTVSMIVSKIAHKQEQTHLIEQQNQQANKQYKIQVQHLQKQNIFMSQKLTNLQNTHEQTISQINRLRSVMEYYQMHNHQLREQIKILNEVIAEMNIQVQKSQNKFEDKNKDFQILKEEYRKIEQYAQQCELTIQQQIQTIKQLQFDIQVKQEESDKWKNRFKEEHVQCIKQQQVLANVQNA